MVNSKTFKIVLSGLMIAVTAICAQISIPFGAVPFTLQIFAIFLTASILPPVYAFLSLLGYVLLGLFGVPVFAGLKGGASVVFGATGGYILTFPIAAFLSSYLIHKNYFKNAIINLAIPMILGLLLIYIDGFLYLSYAAHMSLKKAFMVGVAPFIIFDLIKIGLVIFVHQALKVRKVLNNA
ncbi:biotin transporter BioY [Caldicellulosiruptoraceae bacterium PP1]